MHERVFCRGHRHIALQQFVFEIFVERRFIVTQFRLDPVLRVEQHLAIGFPYPVLFAPLRPLLRFFGSQENFKLQIHEATLDKELN